MRGTCGDGLEFPQAFLQWALHLIQATTAAPGISHGGIQGCIMQTLTKSERLQQHLGKANRSGLKCETNMAGEQAVNSLKLRDIVSNR